MKKYMNFLLVLGVIALAVIPLCIPRHHTEESFGGSDDQATNAIAQVDPQYHRWAVPLFEPPSGEVESFLFALQAALGAGVLFYYIGYMRGRREGSKVKEDGDHVRA